jgi:protein-disulfide isomerase
VRFTFPGACLVVAALLAAPVRAQDAPQAELDPGMRAAIREEIRSYLLENPEILVEMYSLLEARQQAATDAADSALISQNADALYDDGFSYVGGNPEGDVTIVEFLDYQCGFCRRAHPEVAELVAQDGNIRWIVKEFPILGPNSEQAARIAISTLINAGEDAYARLHDALMESNGTLAGANLDAILQRTGLDPDEIRADTDADAVTDRIAKTRALADALEISGTPTFILGDDLVRGYVPIAQMRTLVAEARSPD